MIQYSTDIYTRATLKLCGGKNEQKRFIGLVGLGSNIFGSSYNRCNTWIWTYFRSFPLNSKMVSNNLCGIIHNFSNSSYNQKSLNIY